MNSPATPVPNWDEIRREIDKMERELTQAELPPSDWKEEVDALLEHSRDLLRKSPIGQGRLLSGGAAPAGTLPAWS
jgi:hypothetical protein